MNYLRFIAKILPVFICSFFTEAADVVHYTTSQGLSGTDVPAICADDNYLWIATNDGLNRFDGKHFKVYRHSDADPSTLAESNIETLMLDSKGLLWIGYKTAGADIFDPRMDRVKHISGLSSDFPRRVVSIFEDSRKNIWLGTWEDGLWQLKPNGEKSGDYEISHHYPNLTVVSMLEKPHGKLWIGTHYGYYLYDLDRHKDIPVSDNPIAVTQLLDTGKDNSLWLTSWGKGLQEVSWNKNLTQVTSRMVANDGADYFRMTSMHPDQLCLSTWGDGLRSLSNTGVISRNTFEIDAPVVMSFYRDRFCRLWIGTYGMGLYCVNNIKQGISSVHLPKGVGAAYAINAQQDGTILVGTQGGGLLRLDAAHKEFNHISSPSTKFFGRYILSLTNDGGRTFVGNDDEGLGVLEQSSSNLQILKSNTKLGKITSVLKSQHDPKSYWVGTKQYGLFLIRLDENRKVVTESHRYNLSNASEITGLTYAPNGKLWISSHGGLYLFDPINRGATSIPGITGMIYAMADLTSQHTLWLATSTGVKAVDYSNMNTPKISIPFAGFCPDECVRALSIDGSGNIWFVLNNRVFCHTPVSGELRELNLGNHGDQLLYSVSISRAIDGAEAVIFGGVNKLITINPKEVLFQPARAKILFTGIDVNHTPVGVGDDIEGEIVLSQAPEYVKSICLSYKSRWIDLRFAEVGWDNYQNRYQYFLKGFSDQWQNFDINTPLRFSQLNPGKYQLLIRPLDGTTDPNPLLTLDIEVVSPWWQTTIFYVILAVVIILSTLLIVWYIRNYYYRKEVTRVKNIEKQKKEEILEAKENFFTGLSHDLLTSFSLILAPTSDLLGDSTTTPEQKEKLNIVLKNAEFLSDLFRSMLDYKRVELMDSQVNRTEIDLISHIQMNVGAFAYMAEAAGLTLTFEHSQREQLMVYSDRIKFDRIMGNLIGNAIKYTPIGGTVTVKLSETSTEAVIEICDTGVGISEEDCARMFGKFYRGDNSNVAPGLGLGLYTTRRFVEAIGGSIGIKSQKDVGTTVTFTLPLNLANIDENLSNPELIEESQDRIKVLLVEDNPQMANYLKSKLSEHFDVITASNGEEALEAIEKNMPELVISDVMMPKMDGLELCRRIKSKQALKDIIIVLLSAKNSPEDATEGYEAGADVYLRKPFDPQSLIAQIKNLSTTMRHSRRQMLSSMITSNEETSNTEVGFIDMAVKIVEQHIMDENFKIDDLASEMGMSKPVLNRKFKHLVGETPNSFIRNIRLHKAAVMLRTTQYSVSEISYMVGFGQTHYFIKRFKELFGDTPGNFRETELNNKTQS